MPKKKGPRRKYPERTPKQDTADKFHIQTIEAAKRQPPVRTVLVTEEKNEEETKIPESSSQGEPESKTVYIKQKSFKEKNKIKIRKIAIGIAAALVLAGLICLLAIPRPVSAGRIDLCDTSVIKIEEGTDTVEDSMIESSLEQLKEKDAEKTELKEGDVVKEGDDANIDYSGHLASTGEVFEGGTATDQDVKLEAGSFVDGFTEQIVGHKVGETFEIDVTFPEDYTEELAGKDAIFTITIHSASHTDYPEMDDAWAQRWAKDKYGVEIKTMEEFRKYVQAHDNRHVRNACIYDYLKENSTVKSYNKKLQNDLQPLANAQLDSMAGNASVDAATYASWIGYESAEAYIDYLVKDYLTKAMIAEQVSKQKKITYTEKDVDEALELYILDAELEDYTVEKLKEEAGETWLWLFEHVDFQFGLAMDSLKDNIEYISAEEAAAIKEEKEKKEAEKAGAEEITRSADEMEPVPAAEEPAEPEMSVDDMPAEELPEEELPVEELPEEDAPAAEPAAP